MSISKSCQSAAVALFAAVCALPSFSAQAAADQAGPSALAIAYHTTPANRIAFRAALAQSTLPLLRKLKSDGTIESYRVLLNRYVDTGTWEAMTIVSFPKEKGLAGWKQVEAETPAALSKAALELTTSIDTAPLDLVRENGAAQSSGTGVFLVIPYQLTVPVVEYLTYLDGYVLPQADGWMAEGVVSRYGIYLPAYPAGRPWQSLLVIEYKSDAALAAREATVAKVRGRLKEDPAWKAMSDTKKNVRNELAPAVADTMRE